jgi:hypothetical protein
MFKAKPSTPCALAIFISFSQSAWAYVETIPTMKWANTRLSLAPVTGGRAGLEAEGKATTEELEETSREVMPEERARLVTAADAAVVVVYPPGTPTEVSAMLLLAAVEAAEEAIKPETGSTALGLIDAIVGTADAALLPPEY